MLKFSSRLFTLQRALGIKKKDEIAKKLGVSRTMLYNYEQNDPPPPPEILSILANLEREAGIEQMSTPMLRDEHAPYSANKRIPVVGWAHAGDAESYEELPHSWQEQVPTDCRDPSAFAVRLEGNSMEPDFREGDLLILQPSEQIYSGCLAVLKLKDDGIIFRRIELRGELVILVPLNPQYRTEEIHISSFSWAYPVWGMWRQVWK